MADLTTPFLGLDCAKGVLGARDEMFAGRRLANPAAKLNDSMHVVKGAADALGAPAAMFGLHDRALGLHKKMFGVHDKVLGLHDTVLGLSDKTCRHPRLCTDRVGGPCSDHE